MRVVLRAASIAACLAAGALALAGPVAAGDAAFVDGANDTFNSGSGIPQAECHADIRSYAVRYTFPSITFSTTTACGANPFTSPNWGQYASSISWDVEVTGNEERDFVVDLRHRAGQLGVDVYSGPSVVCGGSVGWDGGATISVTIGASCVGAPTSLRVSVGQTWEPQPGTGTLHHVGDVAPGQGFTGAIQRTIPSSLVGDGPGAAASGSGQTDVFVRGGDDGLYTRHHDGATWQDWQGLGGKINSTPAAASRAPGGVDVFVRGQDNGLYTRHREGPTWGDWQGLGGVLSTAPAAVSASPGTLDIFVAGADRALYRRHFDGSSWGGWEPLGGIITAAPAATSTGPGDIAVFARGQDDALWTQTSHAGTWSGWQSLGGIISTAPGAASRSPGTVDVFAAGADGAVWTRRYDGGWGGWSTLGGVILSPPAPVSASPGTVEVFARGLDAALWASRDTGAGFTGWYSLGGAIR